jgi:ribosome biogenesis GTPase
VLAANVDVIGVVAGLDRPLSANRLERTLVLAWESGADPVVILTKSDVSADPDGAFAAAEGAAMGVTVVVTSASSGAGIGELRKLVSDGRTLALLGPSGTGKSTLVNILVGEEVQRTGGVREADSRGRHTTTSRELVPVPGGGVLLDTPGLRSLGLLDADVGISVTFADVEELAASCRFSDCAHVKEPGCSVRAAIANGTLESRRLENYRKLLRELAHEERRQLGPAGIAARRELREHWIHIRRNAAPPRMDERRQRHR